MSIRQGLLGFLLFGISAGAASQTLEDEAVSWLQQYIQIDTINPPGNETRAVDFLAEIFEAEGIEYETAESAPGRGNIWARLEGGDEPGLILLQHSDVVPANEEFWTIPVLSGAIRDGFILGRGARDMKGLGTLQLATFLALHRSGVALNRDVVFLATADEEAGGFYGVGWLIENRPEIFEDIGILLNEGGGGSRRRLGARRRPRRRRLRRRRGALGARYGGAAAAERRCVRHGACGAVSDETRVSVSTVSARRDGTRFFARLASSHRASSHPVRLASRATRTSLRTAFVASRAKRHCSRRTTG